MKEASKLTVANVSVEQELVELFLLIKSKGLRLELSYEDSLVGKVRIDGDVDMKSAVTTHSLFRGGRLIVAAPTRFSTWPSTTLFSGKTRITK